MIKTTRAVEAALKRLERFKPGDDRVLTLDRLLAVLETLGNPHLNLPPTIHVAGTNGKGSTIAFIRAMAEAAGLKVHTSTSPHLARFNERIRLAGSLVSDEALLDYLTRVEAAIAGRDITFFEATQAAAFLAFSEVPADLLILEVGLGGRFDASNVIEKNEVSVITPVDLDHQAFLGNTISKIARDKAGILKPGCPAVSAAQHPEARAAIAEEAAKVGAPLGFLDDEDLSAIHPPLGLKGPHQTSNAALAAKALKATRFQGITDKAVRTGCAAASWPARMQRLSPGPITALARGRPVWLDGGHNPHAARALAETLGTLDQEDPATKTVLVSAMLNNKDAQGFYAELAPVARAVFTCPIAGNDNSSRPDALADKARAAELNATAHETFRAAFEAACRSDADRILICGSLYLAGQVLKQNDELPS